MKYEPNFENKKKSSDEVRTRAAGKHDYEPISGGNSFECTLWSWRSRSSFITCPVWFLGDAVPRFWVSANSGPWHGSLMTVASVRWLIWTFLMVRNKCCYSGHRFLIGKKTARTKKRNQQEMDVFPLWFYRICGYVWRRKKGRSDEIENQSLRSIWVSSSW